MQAQLEQLEQDYGIEWRAYRLGDLFCKIVQGRRLKTQDQISGTLPFVMSGVTNTGVVDYIGNQVQIFPANSLTVDIFGNVFYRDYEYGMGDDTGAFWNTDNRVPKEAMLYIAATMQNFLSGKFDYGNKLRSSKAYDFEINLPTTTKDNQPHLAFDFMEAFIATLKAERIATLKGYLKATGLSDYRLSAREQAALDSLDAVQWGVFRISDVFNKLNLKNNNPSFEKLRDTSPCPTDEFTLQLVNAKLGNNGIMFYGREDDFDSAEMTIDVVSNGAVATGTVYAQPGKTGVLWDAYLLNPIADDINKEKLLYLAATLQKSIKTKFGWEDKAVWSKVQNEFITLPIKPNQTPDYDFMADFIAAMHKVVIKNVVDYADRDIAAHQYGVEA